MSWLACEVCGFLINTDHDPECFQEWTNGEECIVCQRCREGKSDDSDLREVPLSL